MSDQDDWAIAPPPFSPEAALQTLKRFVRDQQLLAERGDGFMLAGNTVLQLGLSDGVLTAKLAKRASLTPEWDAVKVTSQPELRKLQDEIKRRLARWTEGRHG